MVEKKRARLVRRRVVIPVAGRGPLYAWLWSHYEQVAAFREMPRRPWPTIMLDMIEDGVCCAKSDALTEKNVRATWQRVVADAQTMAKARASAAPAKPTPPPKPSFNLPPLAAVQPPPFRSQEAAPTFRPASGVGPAAVPPMPDFPTVDPAGNPLPEGHVFYNGKAVTRRVAEMRESMMRKFREMDRAKR